MEIIAYHGTRSKFNDFYPNKPISALGNEKGIYFTRDKSVAKEYAMDVDGALDDKSKGLGLDDTGLDSTDGNKTMGDDDKILGIPKTAFWIGVSAIALIGGFLVYKKFIAKK